MNLEFFVKNKRITRKGFQPVVADTTGHYTFTVDFDREWDGLVKVVVFQNGGETAELIYTGQEWLPDNVSKRGDLFVACHGYRKLGDSVAVVRTVRMTQPVRILESGPKAGGEPERYTPTIFEQVLAAAGAAGTAAQEAKTAKTELLAAKETGALDGRAATVTVGTVATGEPGTEASVINAGTESAAVLNFVLPRGATGPQGLNGKDGTVAFEALSEEQKESLRGPQGLPGPAFTYEDFTAEQLSALTGPQGPKGDTGAAGPQGPQGETGPQGAAGRGVKSITYDQATNLWTVTFTDDATQSVEGPAIPDLSTAMPKAGGTFTGAAYAMSGAGTAAQLRNTGLYDVETDPTVNGQINWTYE